MRERDREKGNDDPGITLKKKQKKRFSDFQLVIQKLNPLVHLLFSLSVLSSALSLSLFSIKSTEKKRNLQKRKVSASKNMVVLDNIEIIEDARWYIIKGHPSFYS